MNITLSPTHPVTNVQEPTFQVASPCPTTRRLAARQDNDPLAIPGGRATWWYCSACHGWHVSIENNADEQ